ncbi:hypothetical protein [Chryseobacterium sp. YIM B08800]|uniref:hypothetical protein n=1 Tax=Chryseobacterium sp. YIM B08800 TaxID=2984136 RepID=UPI00223ED18F|nr:hypothetical protein [Chryseobacterium sp. YIM B08800]
MNEHYILVPKNLNLDQRLAKFPPSFEFNKEYIYYFISKLVEDIAYQNMDKTYDNCPDNNKNDMDFMIKHYTPMCANINQSFFRASKLHLDYLYLNLPNEGRFFWRNNYEEGKCFSYRLPEYYWGNGELELILLSGQSFVNKIKKENPPFVENKVRKKFGFTINYFDTKRFELDEKSALKDLYTEYQKTGNYQKYLLNAVRVMNLKNGHYTFHHNPETDGRLHTVLTQFPKICRKHLKYDNERLSEIDLSSSVPFILSYILYNYNTLQPTDLTTKINSKDLLYHYILVKNSVKPSDKEIQHFKDLILNNKLYNYFMNDFTKLPYFEENFQRQFNRAFDGDEDDLRKYSKKRFLSMLFAKPIAYKNEQTVFAKYFPTINNLLLRYKRKKFRDFKKSDWHKKLSYLTFQLESHFMVNIIAREINNVFKRKIPLFTLHDCIVVKKQHLDIVYKMIEDIFIREIGYAPNLTKEVWG